MAMFAKNEALYHTLVCRTLVTVSLYTDIQKGISETMETKQSDFRTHLCSGYLLLQNKPLQSLVAIYYYQPHFGVDEA